jgi:3-dehydroquinate dehydratase-2
VEVHISDVSTREAFRHHSYVSLAAKHTIIGHGIDGYREGIEWLAREPKSREIHTNSFPCL